MYNTVEKDVKKQEPNSVGLFWSFVLLAIAIYFWESPLLLPIKYLTVFFHELSHGISAVLTGGEIARIELSFNQGGLCYTAGGIRWIVLSAGYLGSLVWGCAILILNVRYKQEKVLMNLLSIIFIISIVLWVRNFEGIVICSVLALITYLIPKYATTYVCDVILNFIALASCFYAIIDIKGDLIDRTVGASDAARLGEMFLLPGWLIGSVWLVMAVIITYKAVSYSLKR